jgi:hypothetical protein
MRRYRRHHIGALLTCSLTVVTGCDLAGLLKQNTRTVEASTEGIAANSRVVERSTAVTQQLLPAMEGLVAPMNQVAGLRPTLASVAALDGPMSRVAALDRPMSRVAALDVPMSRVAALDGPMTRVALMRSSLDGVSALSAPMERVASLRGDLRAVAELQGSMRDLAALRQPLVQVAELRQPMAQLAALNPLGHPFGAIALAVLALAAWGAVTFFAVRFAVISAMSQSRPH